jgi:hypothetical protein
MFFGFDLKEIFMFPFKDEEARKHLLIGCLVALVSFIIPILPILVMFGYAVRIAKQVLNNESPHMIAWDDWGGLAKDGLKMFGIRMIFTLPLLLLLIPFILVVTFLPILMASSDSANVDAYMAIYMLVIFGGMCLFIPLSIPIALITPAAEMYAIEKDDFAAGFRFREWWPVFRANLSGFIAAFAIYYVTSMVLAVAIQIIGATVILACLLIVLFPFMTIYITLIMYVTIAEAYKDGKAMLAEKELAAPAPSQTS